MTPNAGSSPKTVATLRFPAPSSLRVVPSAAPETSYSPDVIELLRQRIAIDANDRPVSAEYTEDGSWRSSASGVAHVLNEYFGAAARIRAFPTLPSEPIAAFADAVAKLFGARIEWSPGASPDRAISRRVV
jgi:hypothetical protein